MKHLFILLSASAACFAQTAKLPQSLPFDPFSKANLIMKVEKVKEPESMKVTVNAKQPTEIQFFFVYGSFPRVCAPQNTANSTAVIFNGPTDDYERGTLTGWGARAIVDGRVVAADGSQTRYKEVMMKGNAITEPER